MHAVLTDNRCHHRLGGLLQVSDYTKSARDLLVSFAPVEFR
jgi:hypothetical protein